MHSRKGKAFHISILAAMTALSISLLAQDGPPPPLNRNSTTPRQQPSSPNQAPATTGSADSTALPTAEGDDAGVFVFKKKVEEVLLHAVVVDPDNRLISNLNRDAFTVYEDGKLQKMTSFRQENVPIALGILIDNSGSMRPKREKVNEAALNLIRSSNPQDEVFVVNFGEDYYLDQDFTGDVAKLKTALDKVQTSGSTALYDAIVASAAHIRRDSKIQKRILLAVTDGKDNASQESLNEAVKQLQRADGPVIYVIAFVNKTKGANSTIRALQTISESTGGTAYFPRDLSEVDSITKSIAYDIRNQYVIGYHSSNSSAAQTYHTIDVQASAANQLKLRVRTRTGYYSDASPSSDY